jgi:hypothetical protein
MKKQLNVDQIQSELRGGSAFFPGYQGRGSPIASSREDKKALTEDNATSQSAPAPTIGNLKEVPNQIPERESARSPVRPNGKRIITRNSFEIYEDQMDSLRKLSLQDKMAGKIGSMSQMVRDAIDAYLEKKPL